MDEAWGILEPSDIPSARRLQSLGLTRAIRRFNEKAVPGMGGLSFAMPLIWSMLGIAVARRHDRRPIEVANAIEALAMKMELDGGGEAHPRVRGRRNLPRVGWTIEDLRKPGAYVTQPFRQACTQPLLTLGLVKGTSVRFNSFHLSQDSERLLAPLAAIQSKIEEWAEGGKRVDWEEVSRIRPTADLPKPVRAELMRRIYGGGREAERRKSIRDIGKQLTSDGILADSPKGLSRDHLLDLRGGIATVRLRSVALQVLGAVEGRIAKRWDEGLTPVLTLVEASHDKDIRARIEACVAEATRAAPHIETAGEEESRAFLRDCQSADELLQRLARRDGVVIVLRDDDLVPGPAFGAGAANDADGDGAAHFSGVPELPHIASLLALTEDLLAPSTHTDDASVPK